MCHAKLSLGLVQQIAQARAERVQNQFDAQQQYNQDMTASMAEVMEARLRADVSFKH